MKMPRKPAVEPTAAGWWFLLGSLLLIAVYTMYGSEEQNGLGGYIEAAEIVLFGFGTPAFVGVILMTVLSIPLFLIVWALEKIAPSLLFRTTQPSRASVRLYPTSWKGIFAVSAIPLILAAVMFPEALQDEMEKIHKVDLARAEAVPQGVKFVELNGVLAPQYAVQYKRYEGRSSHLWVYLYEPVTAPGWKPGDPVRYFLQYSQRAESSGVELPIALHEKAPAKFSGKLGSPLPVYVAMQLKANGLKIDQPYSVVDWGKVPSHRDSLRAKIYVGIVLVLSLALLGELAAFKILSPARPSPPFALRGHSLYGLGEPATGLSPGAPPDRPADSRSGSVTYYEAMGTYDIYGRSATPPPDAYAAILRMPIGITTAGDVFSPLIEAGQGLPYTRSMIFSNAIEGAPDVAVELSQKDSTGNERIASLRIPVPGAAPSKSLSITVTLIVSTDKTMRVKTTVGQKDEPGALVTSACVVQEFGPYRVK
jgi:hypothetical protein